jgi:hypothetical protein
LILWILCLLGPLLITMMPTSWARVRKRRARAPGRRVRRVARGRIIGGRGSGLSTRGREDRTADTPGEYGGISLRGLRGRCTVTRPPAPGRRLRLRRSRGDRRSVFRGLRSEPDVGRRIEEAFPAPRSRIRMIGHPAGRGPVVAR